MITSATQLYCVLGSPVSHSKSPVIHNAAFKTHNIDAAYLAFEPQSIQGAVAAMKTLGIKGASVTLPFKETVMDLLDWVDPDAREIGAVNTIVNQAGKLLGYNTDSKAAVDPLLTHGIENKTVCIVGAGGAARAVAQGIKVNGGNIVITNRSAGKGKDLAAHCNGQFIPLEKACEITADVIINTTSLGMEPHAGQLSFPHQNLHPDMVVMDVVYTPLETLLLKKAKEKGCAVIDGLTMFVSQAAAQFELWTGIKLNPQDLRPLVLSE